MHGTMNVKYDKIYYIARHLLVCYIITMIPVYIPDKYYGEDNATSSFLVVAVLCVATFLGIRNGHIKKGKQERLCKCNVTFRRVRSTIVAVGNQ
jgi:hypothetical protein